MLFGLVAIEKGDIRYYNVVVLVATEGRHGHGAMMLLVLVATEGRHGATRGRPARSAGGAQVLHRSRPDAQRTKPGTDVICSLFALVDVSGASLEFSWSATSTCRCVSRCRRYEM